MMALSFVNWILAVVGAIGGCFGVASFFYVRRQTNLMNSQARGEEIRKVDDAEWSARFEEAATTLARVGPKWIGPEGEFYHSQFADPNVRTRIEQHLIHIGGQNRDVFQAKSVNTEALRVPAIRQTIDEVLKTLNSFKTERPDDAERLGL
ncbi:MAG TPA: hypothetical protein VGR81_03165 [Candidatus Acidoferrales bacterium]|nr:hypothetical protein [Candidatus Acidoferrales bacterium]